MLEPGHWQESQVSHAYLAIQTSPEYPAFPGWSPIASKLWIPPLSGLARSMLESGHWQQTQGSHTYPEIQGSPANPAFPGWASGTDPGFWGREARKSRVPNKTQHFRGCLRLLVPDCWQIWISSVFGSSGWTATVCSNSDIGEKPGIPMLTRKSRVPWKT